MSPVRVANAPLSYGAFEMTVGTDFAVPEPEQVLEAIGGAGYAGTDLGPPGYLGEGDVLRERLETNALEVVGGFVPMRFSEAEGFDEDTVGLEHTLDLFDAAGATAARPVLCDAGGPERIANPGRGGEDASLRLGDARWRALADNVERAAEAARERGYEPVFHHHTSTYVEGIPEIERLLEDTEVTLLLDSGHLAVAGGDAVTALRDWSERVGAVHIKDVRLGVLETVKAERADTLTAWRRGLFCALGEGDVDLEGFCAGLTERGYDGWVVVEQDRVLENGDSFAGAREEQVANREWLREHAGW
jgi:inosose dehydratase